MNIGNHLNIQYYLYAENEFIASVSPVRAEYEFYNLNVSVTNIPAGALRINELMASNTDFVADESGNFEDWIELYNATDSEIKCLGLYFSDNADNKLKWAFPDNDTYSEQTILFKTIRADKIEINPGDVIKIKIASSDGQRRRLGKLEDDEEWNGEIEEDLVYPLFGYGRQVEGRF